MKTGPQTLFWLPLSAIHYLLKLWHVINKVYVPFFYLVTYIYVSYRTYYVSYSIRNKLFYSILYTKRQQFESWPDSRPCSQYCNIINEKNSIQKFFFKLLLRESLIYLLRLTQLYTTVLLFDVMYTINAHHLKFSTFGCSTVSVLTI